MIELGASCGNRFLVLAGEPKGGVRSQRWSWLRRLSPAPLSPRPRPRKVTKWEIHARIGYRALRFAQSTRRKAQDGLRTSDSGSLHHSLGFEVRLHAKSVTQGPAIVRIVRRPHPTEARTMATIPTRTASGGRCQAGLLVQPPWEGRDRLRARPARFLVGHEPVTEVGAAREKDHRGGGGRSSDRDAKRPAGSREP